MNNARFIEVDARPRYWEDASLNGKADREGMIPLRNGDSWQPIIDLATGRIVEWPEGVEAKTCYKVCDEGDYWLLDASKTRIAKWKRSYVPARFFDTQYDGIVSDYIVLKIGRDGVVNGWKTVHLDPEQWVPL